jgi:hypothetical protein
MGTHKFIEVPSGHIACPEQGPGPVALFVHGTIVNSHLWRHQLAGLSLSIGRRAECRAKTSPCPAPTYSEWERC